MPIPSAQTQYCSQLDVETRLSTLAVDLHTDDMALPSVADCLNEASADIDFWLGNAYKPAYLATNNWVSFCCRSLACYFVCIRRGNEPPASVQADYEKYLEMLKLIASGEHKLPTVPTSPGGMAVSNQTYDNNRYPALVIERPRTMPIADLPIRRFDPNADSAQGGLTGN